MLLKLPCVQGKGRQQAWAEGVRLRLKEGLSQPQRSFESERAPWVSEAGMREPGLYVPKLAGHQSWNMDCPRGRTWLWVTLVKATEKNIGVGSCLLWVPGGMNPSVLKGDLCGLPQCSLRTPSISASVRTDRYSPNNTVHYVWCLAFSQWLAIEYVNSWYTHTHTHTYISGI